MTNATFVESTASKRVESQKKVSLYHLDLPVDLNNIGPWETYSDIIFIVKTLGPASAIVNST